MAEVKCKIIEHETCLKCGSLESTMIKIGVLTMCPKCWQEEFNAQEIYTQSEIYQNYVHWLNETEYGK